ncbi:MAG: FkbM family methyltransferase [Pseudomonadota bacterium]
MSMLFHRWPLLSGCGSLASSRLACSLVPRVPDAVWGKVAGYDCLVPLDDLVGRAILLVGDLDRKVTWALDRLVRPGDTVLDVGANLGLVSLLMARRVGAEGQVFAFDPSPRILPYLRATLAANSGLPIVLEDHALGRTEDRLTLHVPAGNAGCASLVEGRAGDFSVEVAVRPLSAVFADRGITRVDFMKIDVEGFEAEVLQGLFDDASAPRPCVILFEENAPATSLSFGLLRDEGYRLFGLPKRSYFSVTLVADGRPGFADCHDYMALRADLPANRTRFLAPSGI